MRPQFPSLPTVARAGVLLALFVFTGCKEKPKAVGNAKRVEKAPEAQLSTSSEPWQELAKDPDKLALQNGATATGGQLRLAPRSAATVRDSAEQTDGAIRFIGQYQPSEAGVAITARIQDTGSRYSLTMGSETAARLAQILGSGEEVTLKEFPIPTPLKPGKPYELELRAVGNKFTAKVNGATVGEHEDSTFASGMMGVSLDVASPVLLGALQYLPLGNSAPAASDTPEKWITVLDNSEFIAKSPGIKIVEDGATVTGWTNLLAKPAQNCAIRVTMENTPRNSPLRLAVRHSAKGQYHLHLNERGLAVRRFDSESKGDMVLIDQSLPGTAQRGQDVEIELRAVGPRITVKINGEVLQETEDTKVKEGQIGIGAHASGIERYGEPKIKKLDYMVLDR